MIEGPANPGHGRDSRARLAGAAPGGDAVGRLGAAVVRKIVHVDMDAFYASVEQRDHPELRGRPVAVGGDGRRGVVMAASYEARRFGVRSAMPSARARRLCPELVVVRPRFEAYHEASRRIREILLAWTDLVEPLALDEAYLDVTEPKRDPGPATRIARLIKDEIRAATGLAASAGVSYNRFLAKLASGLDKPDGLTVIRPGEAAAILAALPVERFHGIGPATAARLRALGIATGADLAAWPEADLVRRFGRAGGHFARIARGIDERPVVPDRARKSLGVERTFGEDLVSAEAMADALVPIARSLAERLDAHGQAGRTLTLKIKHADFTLRTRSRSFERPIAGAAALSRQGRELLLRPPPDRPVRLLGLTLAGLGDPLPPQLELALGDEA
jgi:DNA polymerase IV